MTTARVKALEYVNGTLTELDLGPAPKMVSEDVSFDYVFEGRTYHRCYVEREVDDAFNIFKLLGLVIC